MNFWQKLKTELKNGHSAVLMYVLDSQGSSPGRQGFKMFVSASGVLSGSIGGGMMEYKLVEYCKADLMQKSFAPFIKKQIHQADVPKDKSGMICSGEQTIAFYRIEPRQLPLIRAVSDSILKKTHGLLQLNNERISFESGVSNAEKYKFFIENDRLWNLTEDLSWKPRLYIIGAGHVSLALCRLAAQLDFSIHVLDDRLGLNTAPPPELASYLQVADYSEIAGHIPENQHCYVVLMSFGYRTDKIILKQLLHRRYRYFGMMGSAEKVKTLFVELEAEGFERRNLEQVHAPVGLPIHSKTPEEIAVSILAELIREKNG